MASPQTVYTGSTTVQPVPLIRVYFDGATTLTANDAVCYDLSVGDGKTVIRPATADLSGVAGIYSGAQGGSISTAQYIDIVPVKCGAVVTVNCASAAYADNEGVIAKNATYASGLASGNGAAAIVEPGFIGIAVGTNGTTTTPLVFLMP